MEIEETENYIYVTMPYEDAKEYVDRHYDYEDVSYVVNGKSHHILDCQVSDSGKSVTLICVK